MTASGVQASTTLQRQAYFLLTLNMALWAGNMVLGRFIAGHVPPIGVSWVRWMLAAVILLPFAWEHLKRDWPQIRSNLPMLCAIAIPGVTCYNTLAFIGLQYTSALNGTLLQSTFPMVIGLWSFILFRDRLTLLQILGILISLAGVATILTQGHLERLAGLRFNIGDVWILAALSCYALYAVLQRRRPQIHWLSMLFVVFVIGGGALTPFFLWEISTGYTFTFDWETAFAIFYTTVGATLAAFALFNWSVGILGANRTGTFFHLIPLFGALFSVVLLGEDFRTFHLAGVAAILTGIAIAARAPRASGG